MVERKKNGGCDSMAGRFDAFLRVKQSDGGVDA